MTQKLKAIALCGLLLAGIGTAAATAGSKDGKHCFNGYAYTEDGSTLLYTEHHEQSIKDGRPLTWTVVYRAADAAVMGAAKGKVVARKQFDFTDNPTVPVYTLDLLASGYREGIRHDTSNHNKGWRMIRRKSKDAAVESQAFTYSPPMAADSGFDPFVKEHFQALMAGKTIKFNFAAAGRLDVIGLRAYKVGDTQFAGHPAVKFKAELDSLLRFVVNSLVMTYDPDSKKLLQYAGVSNLHNSDGNTFPVIIKYQDTPPKDAAGTHTPQGCTAASD